MTSGRLVSYFIVAAGSVAMAVGATVLVMRPRPAPPAADAARAPTAQGHDMAEGQDAAVYIPAGRQQLIGVRTMTASVRTLQSSVRTTGAVTFDETRVAEVHTRVAGWVDRTDVDFVGKPVTRGTPLFSVYSPDLVAAQKEYVLALKARAELSRSQVADTREGADRLVQAARERLRLWDVSDDQVRALEASGEPQRTVTFFSPFDGVVLDRKVVPGQYVTPEMVAYRLADLRSIWVIAQVVEPDLPLVTVGDRADIELAAGGAHRQLHGRVSFIYPDIDPATRRARVRIDVDNPDQQLRLDAYAVVTLRGRASTVLAVPREAVIDTGTKRYVILAEDNGYFRPRLVDVGVAVDDFYPVRSGLSAGDRVVTSAQFLIDSESNLMAAMQAMAGMDMAGTPATAKPRGR
ncbi:MAG: efflux RND transporter periplasmic adaptor subunit [Vicinamibacterales bacterium]